MNQYLAVPSYLRFHPDNDRHTVSTVERYKNDVNLEGVLPAVLGDSWNEAEDLLVADATVFVRSHLDSVEPKDFTLTYSISEVAQKRVWACTNVVTDTRLK